MKQWSSGKTFLSIFVLKPSSKKERKLLFLQPQLRLLKMIGPLRSFYRFAVRSSSAHEGKIIIFERFKCSLTKTIQLN